MVAYVALVFGKFNRLEVKVSKKGFDLFIIYGVQK